jgi:tRNA A37 threonylcarbamoyladenosine modification protein TsaB
MIALSINTVSRNLTCEIAIDNGPICALTSVANSFVLDVPLLVQRGLSANHLKAENVKLFGVVLGPGSWTGIRVGTTFIKSLAMPTKAHVVGLPYVILAAAELNYGDVSVFTRLHRDTLLYATVRNSDVPEIKHYQIFNEEDGNRLLPRDEPCVWLGDDAPPPWFCGEFITHLRPSQISVGKLAQLTIAYFQDGRSIPYHAVLPEYYLSFPLKAVT